MFASLCGIIIDNKTELTHKNLNMKKLFLVLLISSSFISFSQEKEEKKAGQNELTSNLFDLVVAGSFNVNYERLFASNQSLALSATIFDTFGYYDVGYIEDNTAITLQASYAIYFSRSKDHAGFFFYPLMKLRTGEITVEDYGFYNTLGEFIDEEFKYDVGGFSAGFGLGHKWVFNEKFVLGIKSDITRNLGGFDTDYLDEVEFKFGVNFGFRF